MKLDPSQEAAVQLMLSERVAVVTGGPGTGKTTTTRTALDMMDARGESYSLAAPTGKAAKRMSEATGRDAQTIHRLLEYDPVTGGFFCNASCPLDAQVVVIDEASMLDVELGASLLSAIDPTRSRILLVGDADQLPPVSPGQVFADLIASGRVPIARLTTLHRAAAESWVCINSREIIAGRAPSLEQRPDFEFVPVAMSAEVVPALRQLLGDGGRYANVSSQVLIPQHTGAAGVAAANNALQHELNPPREGESFLQRRAAKGEGERGVLRQGDRVIQGRNDYTLEVMNGEVGVIEAVSTKGVTVSFDGRLVNYSPAQATSLDLAYALTIHRTQGSEFDWAVVVCHSTHAQMLTRNLLYTAVTRAKKGVVIVGDRKGIQYATRAPRPGDLRLTALHERIKGAA